MKKAPRRAKKRARTHRPAPPRVAPPVVKPSRSAISAQPQSQAWYLGFAGLFVVLVVLAAQAPPSAAEPGSLVLAEPEIVQIARVEPVQGHPLDEPLRLLDAAQGRFQGVRDYTCTMVKQERIGGQLHPPHVIAVSVRNHPFAVHLKWSEPRALTGQEACYAEGRNDGKMRAKSAGMLSRLGFLSVDVNDPRTRKTSNHSITEAGIGNLLKRYHHTWRKERQDQRTRVQVAEYECNKRRCMRVETIQERAGSGAKHYRSVVYFDKEIDLPVRVECYDWPKSGGSPEGELVEVYNYSNLKLNANLSDSTFNH